MKPTFVASCTVVLLACAFSAHAAAGDAYPNKPVRIITAEPGGGVDFAARLIAQGLTASLREQVIVENRGGAGGAIAAERVARASPDGYTLLLYGSPIWLAPFLRDKVNYDPIKDFAPITLTTRSPTVLVVNPSLAVQSVKDLIALARAKPGALSIGVGGSGTASHLATELFKAMARVDMVVVPYKGSGPVLTALLGGEIPVTFSNAAAVAPHVKSGKLRALAVTSSQSSPLAPDLPTVAASGLPGYESVSIYGMLAPARTPVAIVTRLNHDMVQFLRQPDIKQKFLSSGVETVGNSPREFAAAIKSDMVKLGKVIRDAGIREQ